MYRDAMTPYRPGHHPPAPSSGQRSQLVALVLAAFLGFWGVHRFYTGRFVTGLLQFMTGGGFLIWWFIDVVRIAIGSYTDAEGRRLLPGLASQPPALEEASYARLPLERDPWATESRPPDHRGAWDEQGYDGSCDDAHGASGGYVRPGGHDGGRVPGPTPRHKAPEPILDPLEEKFRALEAELQRAAPAARAPQTAQGPTRPARPDATRRPNVAEVAEVADTDGAPGHGPTPVRLEKSPETAHKPEAPEGDALEESFRELERELARADAKATVNA